MSEIRDEVKDAQIQQAFVALHPFVHDLRERGFDATLHGETHDGFVTCEIRVRIPARGVPVEAREEVSP